MDSISGDQAKAVLDLLLGEDVLDEDTLEDAVKRCPTPELKRCTDILHALLCKDDHDTVCMYYQEEQKDQCWAATYHQDWLERTRDIMEETHLPDEKQLRNAIAQVRGVLQRLATVQGGLEMLGVMVKAIEVKELAAAVGDK